MKYYRCSGWKTQPCLGRKQSCSLKHPLAVSSATPLAVFSACKGARHIPRNCPLAVACKRPWGTAHITAWNHGGAPPIPGGFGERHASGDARFESRPSISCSVRGHIRRVSPPTTAPPNSKHFMSSTIARQRRYGTPDCDKRAVCIPEYSSKQCLGLSCICFQYKNEKMKTMCLLFIVVS